MHKTSWSLVVGLYGWLSTVPCSSCMCVSLYDIFCLCLITKTWTNRCLVAWESKENRVYTHFRRIISLDYTAQPHPQLQTKKQKAFSNKFSEMYMSPEAPCAICARERATYYTHIQKKAKKRKSKLQTH